MRKQSVLISIMLCSVGLLFASGQTVNFKNDLNEAKRQAAREGKLYIVEFMTERCFSCKMMDEVTFAVPQVVDYIRQNYVPVKINVESFDGFVWKEKYEISVLPTIMLFNSRGEVVAKYEESMGSQRMLNILNEHNAPHHRTTSESYVRPAPEIPPFSPPIAEVAPAVPPSTPSAPPTAPAKAVAVHYNTAPRHTAVPVRNVVENDDTGLFEFQVKYAARSGYGVQIGVYAEYGNVLRAVEELERQFDRQILVNIDNLHGRVVYKVIAGGFSSRTDATNFQQQISRGNTDYFIVDLSAM